MPRTTRPPASLPARDRPAGSGGDRPQGREAAPPRRPSWLWRHRRLLVLAWLFVCFAVAGTAYALSRIPLPPTPAQNQTTFIYDVNHRPLALLDSGQDRVPVSLSQVPPVVINAVLSTEDRNFYHHGGVDPVGLARAAVSDLRGRGNLQGGSTITQQYVKAIYVGSQRTLLRKVKEAVLAIKLQRRYTKREILERYLNTIYFGRGAYGIQAAAQTYFGKDVGQLQLPEAALLAGLIRAPELADPIRAPAVARARRADTLTSMLRDHHITKAEAAAARQAPLVSGQGQAAQIRVANGGNGSAYFVEYVRQQLIARYGATAVLSGGLRVTTTLDSGLQQLAYDAVYGPGGLAQPRDPAGALVAVDDAGQVRAMVGGRQYDQSQVNLALGREGGGTGRQAGSTFKPFLLAEAVREGYSVRSMLPAPSKIVLRGQGAGGQDYPVSNFGDEDGGASVSLIDATAHSLNTVYAQLEMDIGPQKLVDTAREMGVVHADLQPNASLVLGTSEVSVLDMAGAYSTLASGGVHVDPQVIVRVTTANGTPLPWPAPHRTTVLTRTQSDVVTYCLEQVVQRGTGTGAAFGRPLAGKTGTTSDFTDAWFIGYTPQLTAAVWIGDPKAATPLHGIHGVADVDGGSIPATLFRRFMSAAAQNPAFAGYFGGFDQVRSFPGRLLRLPGGVGYPVGTGSTTTTAPATTVPASTTVPTSTVPARTTPAGGGPASTTTPRATGATTSSPGPTVVRHPTSTSAPVGHHTSTSGGTSPPATTGRAPP